MARPEKVGIVIHDASGRILRYGSCMEDNVTPQAGPGETVVTHPRDEVYSDSNFYVTGGVITPRATAVAVWDKTTITADGVDEAILSGLPDPVTLSIDGDDVIVTGGELRFTATTIGYFIVVLDVPEYERTEWEIISE